MMNLTERWNNLRHHVYMSETPALPFSVATKDVLFLFEAEEQEETCLCRVSGILIGDAEGQVQRIAATPAAVTIPIEEVEEPEWSPIDYINAAAALSKEPTCLDDVKTLVTKAESALLLPLYEAVETYVNALSL
ncbi:MAG: hypothetical protein IJ168_00180 [Eubacterium sp.]|nr:hypothetical protein [Eubacterium sp.]